VGSSELADNAVDTAAIADQAVALSKLPHGDGSSDGKFLRANNGADPSFETVTSTTINNNADNRVITGSGTANTLNAESNVVIDSSGNVGLGVTSVSDARFRIKGANNTTSAFNDGLMVTSNNETVYKKYSWMGIEAKGGILFSETNSGSLVETMRIQSGGGISFNGDTAAANALDDYEEGTFTPAYDAGGGVTFSYPQQYGFYTKIGDKVTFELYLQAHASTITSGNGGNGVVITGLPFTALNHSRYYPAVTIGRTYFFQLDDNKRIYAYVQSGNSYIRLIQEQNDTAGTIFTAQQLDHNTCEILVSGHYRV